MRTRKKYLLIIAGLAILGCSRKHGWQDDLAATKEMAGNGLRVELTRLPAAPRDSTSLNYRVRLFPGHELSDGLSVAARNGLNYRMDSCFSVVAGNKKFTSDMVQTVNNGMANCFEYLLVFDLGHPMRGARLSLAYQDKYLCGKEYKTDLN